MTSICSPFLSQIKDCKMSMRKLRKKIYKHCIVKQKSKKQKDSTEAIMDIFKQRNVPSFVTETLRKRRSFDISSIKNIVIHCALSLQDVRNRVDLQECQVNALYSTHKERVQQEKKFLVRDCRLTASNSNPNSLFYSTEDDDMLGSLGEESEMNAIEGIDCSYFANNEEQYSKEAVFTNNYLHLQESHLNEDLGFLNF